MHTTEINLAGVGIAKDAARYWSKVDRRGPDDCWLWRGHICRAYGYFYFRGHLLRAHRFGYVLAGNVIPDGLVLRHRCDRKLCQNPRHLEPGTNAQNMREAAERGLMRRGERHHRAKLTTAQVFDVRARVAAGEKQHEIANDLGISQGTVSKVANAKAWAHLPTPTDAAGGA